MGFSESALFWNQRSCFASLTVPLHLAEAANVSSKDIVGSCVAVVVKQKSLQLGLFPWLWQSSCGICSESQPFSLSWFRQAGWRCSSCRLFYRFHWDLERARGPISQACWEREDGTFFSVKPQVLGLLCFVSVLPWLVEEQGSLHDAWLRFVARWFEASGWRGQWAGPSAGIG